MNKLIMAISAAALVASSAPALDNAAITVMSVSQRWPLSRLVDVTYTLSGATGPVDVDVTLTSNGKTESVPNAAISGTARSVTNGGPYRLTFDPTRTAFANEDMLSDCTVTLTPAKKVRARDIRGIVQTTIHVTDEEIKREIERGYAVRGMAGLV